MSDRDSLDAAKENYQMAQELLKQYEANLAEAKLGGRADAIAAHQAEVIATKANVTERAWYLDQKIIESPSDGVIFDTFFKTGEVLAPRQAIAALLSPENIHAIFFISEKKLAALQLGDKVSITCNGCDTSYTATIYYISPTAEYTPPLVYSRKNNHTLVFRVEAKFNANDAIQLHPGQPVYVSFYDKAANHEH